MCSCGRSSAGRDWSCVCRAHSTESSPRPGEHRSSSAEISVLGNISFTSRRESGGRLRTRCSMQPRSRGKKRAGQDFTLLQCVNGGAVQYPPCTRKGQRGGEKETQLIRAEVCRRLGREAKGNIRGRYGKIRRHFSAVEAKKNQSGRDAFLYVNDKIVYSGARSKKKRQKCSVLSLEQIRRMYLSI